MFRATLTIARNRLFYAAQAIAKHTWMLVRIYVWIVLLGFVANVLLVLPWLLREWL